MPRKWYEKIPNSRDSFAVAVRYSPHRCARSARTNIKEARPAKIFFHISGRMALRGPVAIARRGWTDGGFFLTDRGNQTLTNWVIGLTAVASGALLLIGFLTPIVGMLVGLGSAGIALSWPAPTLHLLDSWLVTVFVVIMAAALVFLGPGACSLDCRLFGRREILIPPAPRPPKS